MNFKNTKIVMALSATLLLTLPMTAVNAHEKHCDIKETVLGENMKQMKSELRAYVKSFKADDNDKMQQHLNQLLMISEKAKSATPNKIMMMGHDMKEMDHSKMEMPAMEGMDHSKMEMPEMEGMDHSKMKMPEVEGMDHSKMDHGDMNMDSAEHDMSAMPSMEGMSSEQHHQHMLYMQGMTQLNDLFKALNKSKDKAETKAILGKIKEHSKNSHQQFRSDC